MGSFRINGIDYLIEPDDEFDHLDTHNLIRNSNIKNTEFSFIYLDHNIVTLQTHIIYKKISDTTNVIGNQSCALLGMF